MSEKWEDSFEGIWVLGSKETKQFILNLLAEERKKAVDVLEEIKVEVRRDFDDENWMTIGMMDYFNAKIDAEIKRLP